VSQSPAVEKLVQLKQQGDQPAPAPVDISGSQFKQLIVRHDVPDKILWCFMKQSGRPSYTYSLGEEVQCVQDWISQNYGSGSPEPRDDFKYFVFGSKTPGIYNLGGDLLYFAKCIRTRDLAAMRHYAETCVRMQYANANSFDAPIITMALVQGDALGGGFEHAMAFDIIVAEKSARMGLPEIMFNLFPGMGAYSFLTRRVGRDIAERMILKGKIYSAEELHDLGIVDILVEDGDGERAIIEYTQKNSRRFEAERAVYRARRRAMPISLEELMDITVLWAETAMTLKEADVRKMERLARAQERKLSRKLAVIN